MKITCPYCGNLFNDTLEKCPSCGAPNAGVVRKSGSQPLTVEELKQWYADRCLPPYETTRFFIGIDYRKPRAFGIYRDEKTGNFIVYKNKDNGSRAVRYEGTDEAYAVNELYQRLKEEIIQQKRAQTKRGSSGGSGNTSRRSGGSSGQGGGKKGRNGQSKHSLLSSIAAHPVRTVLLLMLLGLIVLIGGLIAADPPRDGYYSYENTVYFAEDSSSGSGGESINTMYWYAYDAAAQEWTDSLSRSEVPDVLIKDETAKEWFVSQEWSEDLGVPELYPTMWISEEETEETVDSGYYDYDGTVYYHADEDAYDGWFYYDPELLDWDEADPDQLPDELYADDTARDFYYTPTWDASTQITDFTDSSAYEEYLQQDGGWYDGEDDAGWNNADDADDFNWDAGDTWDGGGDTWDAGGGDWDSDW